jgi:hypothetical protein
MRRRRRFTRQALLRIEASAPGEMAFPVKAPSDQQS